MACGGSTGSCQPNGLPPGGASRTSLSHVSSSVRAAVQRCFQSRRWGYADGQGEIGLISSVTQAFCGDCNRARLSTEGKFYLCLFASNGYDLRALVRGAATDDELASAIGHIWQGRTDRYSELRGTLPADANAGKRRVEMSYIGG